MTFGTSSRRHSLSAMVAAACTSFAALVFVVPLSRGAAPSEARLIFQANDASRVRISGHATVGNWISESREVSATIEAGAEWAALAKSAGSRAGVSRLDPKTLKLPHALISIPVTSLECTKPGMRDDLLRALRHDGAPLIVFVLTGISDVQARPSSEPGLGRCQVSVRGDLVLAGKLRAIELTADVVQESPQRFRLDAMKELRMSDFEIVPPTALLGLIRTDNAVTVSFHLQFDRVDPAATAAVAVTR